MTSQPVRPGRVVVLLLVAAAGCTSEEPEEHNSLQDATTVAVLEAPRLAAGIPSSTPLQSVALRGKVNGSSVVVKGGASGPLVRLPLPSGDFCVDVPLQPGTSSTLTLTSLADGLVSPPTEVIVTQSSAAAPPSNPYCDPPACSGPCPETETDCSNDQDDDLDGWTDECDLDCSNCSDDAYEPNDLPANVPILPRGQTYQLKLCPCHDDWFALFLEQDDSVTLSADFDTKAINIDLKLFKASDAEGSGYKSSTPVAKSTWNTLKESITWKVTETNVYYLYVYSREPTESGSYELTVD